MDEVKSAEVGDVEFSEGGSRVWEAAQTEARTRGHVMLGSEHLLWALNTADPPPAATKYLHRFAPATTIAALLERFPPFSTRSTARTASDALDASPRVARIVAEAKRLASRTHTSQVTSDGLLLGILVDARNAAAAIIENASAGAVTATSILRALRLDAGEYLRRYEQIRSRAEPWTLYRVTGSGATSVLATSSAAGGDVGTPAVAATGGGATATVPKAPDINSGHLRRLMQGPTPATNWLLPGAVLMGAMPQSQRELVGVLDAGVTTIVPLVEEISMKHDYPAGIVRYLRDHPKRGNVHILHFPIEDFECVDEPKHLVLLVEELTRRVHSGEVVFVHCLGGHGRTGTVVISLLAALANMDNHTARKHVVAYHNQRERCRGSTWCRLPEVRSQDAQVRAVNPAMRRHYMKDKLAGKKK